MKSRKATICAVLFGGLCGLLFFCGAAAAQEPSPSLFTYLTPMTAYGAVLGLIGLVLQLWLRAEWPTGRLNQGRPKVLDPPSFVLAVIAAIAAGIAATIAFEGDINTALAAAKGVAADAAKAKGATPADITAAAAAAGTTVRLKYGLAILVFGYVAADLGATGLEKIWEGLQLITAPIQALWKRLTGSK
jgi:hypothetical protein